MAIQIKGLDATGGNIADVDSNNNILVTDGIPAWPTAGGFYTVTGQASSVVAATLAANTSLASLRFSASSTRKAYVTRIRTLIAGATLGTSALVPGTIGWQRFTTATPTAGTARTVNRQDEALGSASDMTDVRDSNAALTVTSVVFGNLVASTIVPLFIAGGAMVYEWIVEPPCPIVLNAGNGLALRTQVVMPGTQTWVYSYTVHWFEK